MDTGHTHRTLVSNIFRDLHGGHSYQHMVKMVTIQMLRMVKTVFTDLQNCQHVFMVYFWDLPHCTQYYIVSHRFAHDQSFMLL